MSDGQRFGNPPYYGVLRGLWQVGIALQAAPSRSSSWRSAQEAWSLAGVTAAQIFLSACTMHPVSRKVCSVVGRVPNHSEQKYDRIGLEIGSNKTHILPMIWQPARSVSRKHQW